MLPLLLALSAPAHAEDILMVGASYVSRNNLPGTVELLLDAGSGSDRTVTMHATGGYAWSRHVSDAAEPGEARTILYDTPWNAVLMQEFTDVAVKDPTSEEWLASLAAGTELVRAVEANGADAFLYMTWGDRTGDSTYPDFLGMQGALETAYASYRDTMRAGGLHPYVVPAGVAWRMVYASESDPLDESALFYRLYASDGQHPSPLGSYLTACTMYSALTGLTSVGLPESNGVTPDEAAVLQAFADQAIFGTAGEAYDFPWSSTGEDTGTEDSGTEDSGTTDTGTDDTGTDDSDGEDSNEGAGDGADKDGEEPAGCGCDAGSAPASLMGGLALAAFAGSRRRRSVA